MKREVLFPCSKAVAIDSEPEKLIFSFLKFRLDAFLRPAAPKSEGFFLVALIFIYISHLSRDCYTPRTLIFRNWLIVIRDPYGN